MAEVAIRPEIARMMVGCDDAIVGRAKMVYCDHKEQSLFGGVSLDAMLNREHGTWQMAVGTLIFVPVQILIAGPLVRGCRLQDLVTGNGLDMKNWQKR